MSARRLRVPAPFVSGAALSPLPLFVYGTLLPGQLLAAVVAPYVLAHTVATVEGRLHWHSCGEFPVLVASATSVTVGLRVEVRPEPALMQFLAVDEIGFGYDARWCPLTSAGGGALGPALVFCWPWGAETLGPPIDGGAFAPIEVLEAGYPTSPGVDPLG